VAVPKSPSPGILDSAVRAVRQQVLLVGVDRGKVERVQIVDGGAQPDRAGDVRRARLELVRHLVVGRLLESHGTDHVPAALIGGHGLEQGQASVQHANARRTQQFVSRQGVEVAVEVLHVDLQVRHA